MLLRPKRTPQRIALLAVDFVLRISRHRNYLSPKTRNSGSFCFKAIRCRNSKTTLQLNFEGLSLKKAGTRNFSQKYQKNFPFQLRAGFIKKEYSPPVNSDLARIV